MCSGLFTGVIVQRYGARKGGVVGAILYPAGLLVSVFATSTVYLQVSYGVVSGLGFGFLYVSCNQTIGQCFTGKRKLVAVSVAVATSGTGSMVYPYVVDWLVIKYGLKGTFLILGGITLNSIPLAFTWHRSTWATSTSNRKNVPGETAKCVLLCGLWSSIVKVLKYPPFPFLLIGNGLGAGFVTVFDILSLDIVETTGMTRDQSITAYVALKAASIPARLVPGILSKIPGCSSGMTPVIGSIAGAVGMITLNFVSGYAESIILFVINGLSRGIMIASMSVVPLDMLGTSGFATGLGLVFCIAGVVVVASGPVTGLLRDVSGTYLISLYGTSGFMFLALILCLISMVMHSRIKSHREDTEEITIESDEPDFNVTRF